ncbi:galactokinase [Enemella evansiae]|uniref:galactokinase n=1 Tax=Enemella evansiae TaxID=2016499 RepID=UPI0010D16DDB|nr:galactokinase [Enemella evansiae]TDO93424.1 galactokinase [Enemella evansiae]
MPTFDLPAADGHWFAPGRVNLIGEHTDYNDGFVLPFALPLGIRVAARLRDDDRVTFASTSEADGAHLTLADLGDPVPDTFPGWYAYPAGVLWALGQQDLPLRGLDLVFDSNLPVGAGLSSSAAICCATVAAVADLCELDLTRMQRAQTARQAENDYVGAPTGFMDQAASTLCTAGHALLLDCRDLGTEQVPLDLPAADLELLVLDTRTPHSLVDSAYAERRRSCEQAAAALGVPALRDITDVTALASLTDQPDGDLLLRRARHVVTENARVLAVADLLRAGRVAEIAPALDASHASMRDDFEITVPTVDLAVETARSAGALGARMTGGGFGGCIIALCPTGRAEPIARQIAAAFATNGFGAPEWFTAEPAAGAHRLDNDSAS